MLYLNGKIISETTAAISPNDRGFLLGDGLFETILCYKHQPRFLKEHWDRLCNGAAFLEIPLPISEGNALQIIQELLLVNNLNLFSVARITLTRGVGARGINLTPNLYPTILINVFPFQRKKTPISTMISDICINEQSPLTKFKTLNYLDKIIAKQRAMIAGFDDAILLNTKGRVVSTTTANIFLVKNGALYTPPVEEGALPGITRQRVLNIATKKKMSVYEKALLPDDLFAAKEVFITNSLSGMCTLNI